MLTVEMLLELLEMKMGFTPGYGWFFGSNVKGQ